MGRSYRCFVLLIQLALALELLIQTQLNFAKWKPPTELFLPGDGKTWLYCEWLLVWAYSIRAPASSWRATNLSA